MLSIFGARGELHDLTKARQTSALTRALGHGRDANSMDMAGRTALHVAVDKGYSAEASLLLQHGANVNVADKVCAMLSFNTCNNCTYRPGQRRYIWLS